ncbi:aminodeoxychorismate lyase [Pseudolysobacter antarcticus]|uniref:Aminodeoxychorismate lyase n=1 Tax=Pseudolysobacter antarcticus TaxID=2511995 RepID=A0A411HIA7_9GAMM|nr:aminodeoxychorismate lyase [Pseudolysobacter antarcticus]QBB70233.1 aminodeoxychorismate lyase [Pseudolysobacter antarcticus]
MNARMLINGAAQETISPLDRGFAYGDGLFETLRMVHGRAPLWQRHMQRLAEGCMRLHLPPPDADMLAQEVEKVSADLECAVVRITLTRGIGARGYALPMEMMPTRVVAAFPFVPLPTDSYRHGIRVRWCTTHLALQPLLARIKHLNRLEQILARAEWNDAGIFEGIMCDSDGRVICATAANIFCVREGRLITPDLSQCGIAGVARAAVLDHFDDVEIRDLLPEELMQANEIFLCNSVRGILPVNCLADKSYVVRPLTRELQTHWRSNGWMAQDGEQF